MTDRATISPNGRAVVSRATLAPVGASGVVHYGGVLYHDDAERAWQGAERDRTIRAMLNDPVVGAVLLGVEMLVRRVDWRVDPADDTPEAEAAAEFVAECLADMSGAWPGDAMAKILTFLGWGWSCAEVIYKRRLGTEADPPSRHDDGRIGWYSWRLLPQATREGWRFDRYDDPVALIQRDPDGHELVTVPLSRCLLFRFGSRDNSPEGFTPLRVAYDAWYHKLHIQRAEAIGIERDLAGLPVTRIPGEHIAAGDAVYLAAQAIVTGIRQDSQAGVVIASDRDANGHYLQDIELLSSGGGQRIATDPVVRRYANELVTVFLANVMRTGQDGIGALSLAQEQSGLFQQAIGAHLDTIADVLNEQAVGPLCRINGIPPEAAPRLSHGDVESADLGRLGAYIVQLGQAGLLADTPELRAFVHEVAGLPVPEGEDATGPETEPETGPVPQPETATERRASEPRRLVEDDGTLTLSDLMGVVAWWREAVPEEYRDLLDARIAAEGNRP